MFRKVITWSLGIVIVVYAVTNPHGMGSFLHGLLGVIPVIGSELAHFASSL